MKTPRSASPGSADRGVFILDFLDACARTRDTLYAKMR